MNELDSTEPSARGRRALPADETGGETVAPRYGPAPEKSNPGTGPRRAAPVPEEPTAPAGPRRAVAAEEELPPPAGPQRAASTTWEAEGQTDDQPWYRGAGGWVVLVASVLIVLALWSVLRPDAETPSAVPANASSTAAAPATSPAATAPDETSATGPPASEASASKAPLPATVSSTPESSASPEPSTMAALVELNDASFMASEGWAMYGDDLIEEDRRAVRLSDEATDTRFQAVTLVPEGLDLSESCRSLVELQQSQFTDPTRQLVVPIGLDPLTGAGVRCGFSGVRSSDGIDNTVSFTLVSRASDSHVLMLRATVPGALPPDSPAIGQLNSMSCQASTSFGVTLPLC